MHNSDFSEKRDHLDFLVEEMTPIAQVFSALEGRWTLNRKIPGYGMIEGIAEFQKSETDSKTLHYREDGLLCTLDDKNFTVFREYLYRFQNDTIIVFFKENPERLMHLLEFSNDGFFKTAKARHICDCDIYDAIYAFHLPEEFRLDYSIKGPNKNYSIHTLFQRSTE